MTEYWKWPETVWKAEDAGRAKGGRITAGVDVGTAGVRAAVLSDGKLLCCANLRMGADFLSAGNKALTLALEGTGLDMGDLSTVAATGWGAKHVKNAIKTVDEIHSHAMGARFMFGPQAKTVVDMGAQTVKAISLYDWDRVRDFMLNDKCATGLGRGIEDLCRLICVPITEIGPRSLEVEKDPEPVSTTCSAYALTETMGLMGRPEFKAAPLTENEILASHMFAVAWRVLGVIGRLQPLDVGDIKIDDGLALTGGLAKNPGVVKRIERELGVEALKSEYDPQLAGAIGAALLA